MACNELLAQTLHFHDLADGSSLYLPRILITVQYPGYDQVQVEPCRPLTRGASLGIVPVKPSRHPV